MRNLREYPILLDEKIGAVRAAMEEFGYEKTQLIGDIRPAALAAVLADLEEEQRKRQCGGDLE